MPPPAQAPTLEAFQARLEAAAEAIGSLLDRYEDEVEIRDRAILEALDSGCRRSDVARWTGLSAPRVTQIVARRAAEWA